MSLLSLARGLARAAGARQQPSPDSISYVLGFRRTGASPMRKLAYPGICATVVLASSVTGMGARQTAGNAVAIDNDDIGGVVTSSKGPEAGVWVIAETKELPTGFSRIVVTDDRGRYVVPDLPKATYQVFVRGYGLVDSPKVAGTPGKPLNLTAVIAPNPRAAAEYYPANYWLSLLKLPDKSEFPIQEQGASNGRSQGEFLKQLKTDGCMSCHQLGNKPTREIPASLGKFDSSAAAWARRVASGHDGSNMDGQLSSLGRQRAIKMFADWTDRIAAGEYPKEAPPRPQGPERNVVITQWDWSDPREYFHDVIASDKRNPLVNPNGPVYGLHEFSSDHLTILEPTKNSWSEVIIPSNPAASLSPRSAAMPNPSPVLGRRDRLEYHHQRPQQRDGSEGPRLEYHRDPHGGRTPGLLQGRQSVGEALSDRRRWTWGRWPSVHRLRSRDEEDRHRRYVLQHVPPELRQRSGQHDLERRRRSSSVG